MSESKDTPSLDAEDASSSTLVSPAVVPNGSPPGADSDYLTSTDALQSTPTSSPSTPGDSLMFRTNSNTTNSSEHEDESFPPLDRLTMFDILENLALPQRLERIQTSLSNQTERVRRQQKKLRSTGISATEKVVDEWRKRIPTAEEQLDKYKQRMRDNVDRLGERWSDAKAVTAREKMAFIAGVMNIFISGYLIGAAPEYFHYWYTAQLAYFMPIRWYTYHKIGYHYFLADLCYFVNLLMILAIWFFPQSKRLFISTWCLAFGNNAVAIAMWRNSLVFHSLDKVTSLFIHIMPCATLHCIAHLLSPEVLQKDWPAVYTIKHSPPDSPEHYTLGAMVVWATVPYAVWQLSYHFLITMRRRDKIAAGRPTSFTWLRKSYAKNPLGKFVLSLPNSLQSPAFMVIQYLYALITMIPCPIWFWYRWASSAFLMSVFTWATYNGATFYIDVFGRRMEKELMALKKDVAKWHATPESKPATEGSSEDKSPQQDTKEETAQQKTEHKQSGNDETDFIPLLDDNEGTTAREGAGNDAVETTTKRK